MYQFSRAIYRELASDIRPLPGESAQRAHTAVLEACERTIERMAADRHYFKRPVRTLFNDVRSNFPMGVQRRVWAWWRAISAAPTSGWPVSPSTARPVRQRPRVPRDDPAGHAVPARCRCRTTATARRISISPRPRTRRRSSWQRRFRAHDWHGHPPRGVHRARDHGLPHGGEPRSRGLPPHRLHPDPGKAEEWVEKHGGERRDARRRSPAKRHRHHDGRRRPAGDARCSWARTASSPAPPRGCSASTCRRSPPARRAASASSSPSAASPSSTRRSPAPRRRPPTARSRSWPAAPTRTSPARGPSSRRWARSSSTSARSPTARRSR